MDGFDELAALAPQPRRVSLAGRDFDLLPLRMRQLPAFARHVEPVLPLLMGGRYIQLITDHSEAMLEAVAIATGADRTWLDDLYPDQFVELLTPVVEVNADFFGRRILPAVIGASVAIRQTLAMATSAGRPSSPGSSDADTISTPA